MSLDRGPVLQKRSADRERAARAAAQGPRRRRRRPRRLTVPCAAVVNPAAQRDAAEPALWGRSAAGRCAPGAGPGLALAAGRAAQRLLPPPVGVELDLQLRWSPTTPRGG
jgi:hypothetical protein